MSVSEALGIEPATEPETIVSDTPTTETSVSETAVESDDTQIEVGDTAETGPEIVEAPPIDMEQMGHYLVPVKIDGEESWVPVAEAAQGFQRQADYTRKTQEHAARVAEDERAIQIGRAYEANPQMTARMLAEAANIDLGGTQVQGVPEEDFRSDSEKALDAANSRIAELESKFSAVQTQTQFEREVSALEAEVGEVDRAALVAHMNTHNILNPEVAWAHLNMGSAKAGRSVSANEAAKAAVISSKREAQVVHKPSSTASKSNTATATEVPTNLREAALMADNGVVVPESRLIPDWIRPR